MKDFGIPKKFIYISLAIFAFNMFVAAHTYQPQPEEDTFWQLVYITFPLWACVLAGSLLGFVVVLFPTKVKYSKEVNYVRSKMVGILIVNAVFMLGYLYKLYWFYSNLNPANNVQ